MTGHDFCSRDNSDMNGLSRILLVICFALIGGLFFGYLKYTEMQKKYELELEIANKKNPVADRECE